MTPEQLHCLINENAARKLLEPKRKGWFGLRPGGGGENDGVGGLAQIFVTRVRGDQYLVCSYLVDYWCLGVKNALGPRRLNRSEYEAMVKKSYTSFGPGYGEISLEQARAICPYPCQQAA